MREDKVLVSFTLALRDDAYSEPEIEGLTEEDYKQNYSNFLKAYRADPIRFLSTAPARTFLVFSENNPPYLANAMIESQIAMIEGKLPFISTKVTEIIALYRRFKEMPDPSDTESDTVVLAPHGHSEVVEITTGEYIAYLQKGLRSVTGSTSAKLTYLLAIAHSDIPEVLAAQYQMVYAWTVRDFRGHTLQKFSPFVLKFVPAVLSEARDLPEVKEDLALRREIEAYMESFKYLYFEGGYSLEETSPRIFARSLTDLLQKGPSPDRLRSEDGEHCTASLGALLYWEKSTLEMIDGYMSVITELAAEAQD